MFELINKIDLCDICMKNKAEYLYHKNNFFVDKTRVLCLDCMKKKTVWENFFR